MEEAIVVGLTMVFVEGVKWVAKKYVPEEKVTQVVVPLAVFSIAGALNVASCAVFTPDVTWRAALLEGFQWGAVAGGVFGMGKAVMGKS